MGSVKAIAAFPFDPIFSGQRRSSWLLRLFWMIIPLEYGFAVISGFVELTGNVLFAPMLVLFKMLALLLLSLGISRLAFRLGFKDTASSRILAAAIFSNWFVTYTLAVGLGVASLVINGPTDGGPVQDFLFRGNDFRWLGSYPQAYTACITVMLVYGLMAHAAVLVYGRYRQGKAAKGNTGLVDGEPYYGALAWIISAFVNGSFTAALLAA